jgi:Tol biopolymer transport system component
MPLDPGVRLGRYEIVAPLGAGGMGQVYRARDSRLNRDVAIKILPEQFAFDADRIARFNREAQVLASLNHPNIATIHGFEESDGVQGLVLELVEGQTLADRIAHGPIPLDEALPIARQIAEALEAAHEHGIIHRDLKPANVKVRDDGTVKVLDFGLAKALAPETAAGAAVDISNSPTMTSPGATRVGFLLGTAAYMAPEQAKGKPVDRRADIWAFGVVLFEMLTGKALYAGETAAETLARVIERDPSLAALPKATPLSIRDLIARCLTKDPRARLQAIGEARIVIERAIAKPGEDQATAARAVRRFLPWSVAAILAIGLGAALVIWAPWRTASRTPPPVRLRAELGAEASIALTVALDTLALSPDGAMLAFVGERAGSVQLYVRPLGQLQATALAGTTNARNPFFSPDGQWIAFFADRKLKKIAVAGGAVQTLADAASGFGGAWGDDGSIVFSSGAPAENLQRISMNGGKPESATTLTEEEFTHRWPQVLPEARAILYTAGERNTRSAEEGVIRVQPLPAGAPKEVVRGGYHGRYLSSGHLVYIHEGTLFASRFDLDRLEVTGEAVPVLEGLAVNPGLGSAQYAVSAAGTLVFVSGQSQSRASPILWMDKSGKTSPLRAAAADWNRPRFAPDGARLAIEINDGNQRDVWVYEWAREILTPLTGTPGEDIAGVWTPDGRRLAFAARPPGAPTFNLFWKRADGGGEAERLTESKSMQIPGSWHVSGRYLAFHEVTSEIDTDLMILPMDGDEKAGWKPGTPSVFLKTPFNEAAPRFSPDGKWIAYQSNESRRTQTDVYVRPFPAGPGGRTLISPAGGTSPAWSSSRQELFYRTPQGQIMVVPYTVDGDVFKAEKPQLWSDQAVQPMVGQSFDVHPDGQRLAVAIRAPQTQAAAGSLDEVVFIFGFFDELRRIAPPGR